MSTPAVEMSRITVHFGEFRALEEVSLRIEEKRFVAILGPNGGGKTTLLRTLLGLARADSGWVKLWGRPPREIPAADIGYVPQLKTLDRSFPARAIELVVSGLLWRWPMAIRPEHRRQAADMLERVGASHLADRQISNLSGGELQRVYLARCFVHRPRLIFLDEPATGIDAPSEADFYRILDAYRVETGATILMITHDWDVAYHHANDVVLLNRRVLGFGPPHEALRDNLLRETFGHVGHPHRIYRGEHDHA